MSGFKCLAHSDFKFITLLVHMSIFIDLLDLPWSEDSNLRFMTVSLNGCIPTSDEVAIHKLSGCYQFKVPFSKFKWRFTPWRAIHTS